MIHVKCRLLGITDVATKALPNPAAESNSKTRLELGPQQQNVFFAWLVENKGTPKQVKRGANSGEEKCYPVQLPGAWLRGSRVPFFQKEDPRGTGVHMIVLGMSPCLHFHLLKPPGKNKHTSSSERFLQNQPGNIRYS